jgi:hypothetical protein
LPELLFQPRRFDLTVSEAVEGGIFRSAEINGGYQNQENDKNNKNVTI